QPIKPFGVRWDFPLMKKDETLDPKDLKQAGKGAKFTIDHLIGALGTNKLTATEWKRATTKAAGMSDRKFMDLLKIPKDLPNLKQDSEDRWYLERVTNSTTATTQTNEKVANAA